MSLVPKSIFLWLSVCSTILLKLPMIRTTSCQTHLTEICLVTWVKSSLHVHWYFWKLGLWNKKLSSVNTVSCKYISQWQSCRLCVRMSCKQETDYIVSFLARGNRIALHRIFLDSLDALPSCAIILCNNTILFFYIFTWVCLFSNTVFKHSIYLCIQPSTRQYSLFKCIQCTFLPPVYDAHNI